MGYIVYMKTGFYKGSIVHTIPKISLAASIVALPAIFVVILFIAFKPQAVTLHFTPNSGNQFETGNCACKCKRRKVMVTKFRISESNFIKRKSIFM